MLFSFFFFFFLSIWAIIGNNGAADVHSYTAWERE